MTAAQLSIFCAFLIQWLLLSIFAVIFVIQTEPQKLKHLPFHYQALYYYGIGYAYMVVVGGWFAFVFGLLL